MDSLPTFGATSILDWLTSIFIGHSGIGFPTLNSSTVVGITVAIAGNVLISLALNLQKVAHHRLEAERSKSNPANGNGNSISARRYGNLDESEEVQLETRVGSEEEVSGRDSQEFPIIEDGVESQPLLLSKKPLLHYGSESRETAGQKTTALRASSLILPRTNSFPVSSSGSQETMEIEVTTGGEPDQNKLTAQDDEENEGDYLKSKLWWLGFLLMNVGELGNFISYAFAPASVVAPLGTFALIANCVFAPFMLHEKFKKLDFFGISVAIIGALTVVFSSNASDTRLDPDGLIHAIRQIPFLIYSCIYIAGAITLASLAQTEFGRQWVFVDVGICALFGGFTVLSTKAFSTLLTSLGFEMFTKWITYPVFIVLVATGVGQIKYLNRALMRFDSKIVIPAQFVLFNLSAIIGSAILYQDFKRASFHQLVTFFYGCATTFAGVFIIAWTPGDNESGGDEEAIGNEADSLGQGQTSGSRSMPGVEAHRIGSMGRRSKPSVVNPDGVSLGLDRRSISLVGLSPAQHLLLVHSPPRIFGVPESQDDGFRRPRTLSWFGDGRHEGRRDGSAVGRVQNTERHTRRTGSVEGRRR